MTTFKYQIIAFLLVLLFSCGIPSIHPIYTENTRLINDDIIGSWSAPQPKTTNIKVEFNVSSDDLDDQKIGEKMMSNIFDFDEDKGTWTFERAANIKGEFGKDKGFSATFNMEVIAESLLPEGHTITSKEELPFYLLTYEGEEKKDTYKNTLIVNLTEIDGSTYMDFYPYGLKDQDQRNRFASNFIYGHTFVKAKIEKDKIALYSFNREYVTQLIKEKRIRIKHENINDEEIILTASTQELRAFITQFGDDDELYEKPEILKLQ